MVDDLIDIAIGGLEVAGDLAIAVGGESAKEEKAKRKKNSKFPIVIGLALILTISFFLLRWGIYRDSMVMIVDEFGYIGFVLILLVATGLVIGMGILNTLKKKNKPINKMIIFIFLAAVSSGVVLWGLGLEGLNLGDENPFYIIPIYAITFGMTLLFFLLFAKMGDRKAVGLTRMGSAFIIEVAAPMMPLWIIFLGAMQSKHGYVSIFLREVQTQIYTLLGDGVLGEAIYGTVRILFNLGNNNPQLWIWLIPITLVVLIYMALRKAFFGEKWPYIFEHPDRNMPAQFFIDQANDKFLSKEDLDAFKRNKLRLSKTALDKYENEESLNNEEDKL